MAEKRQFNGSYVACWAGGFSETPDSKTPFVSLQIADAETGPDGLPLRSPNGEIRELFFTDPQQLVEFLAQAFDVARKMFPADVDFIRRDVKRRMH